MYRSCSLKVSYHRGISRRATPRSWSAQCWTGWRRTTSWLWRVSARTVTCQAASRSGPWPSLPWPSSIIVQGALHAFLTSRGSDNRFPETVRLCIKAGGCNCSRANYAGALVSLDKWDNKSHISMLGGGGARPWLPPCGLAGEAQWCSGDHEENYKGGGNIKNTYVFLFVFLK